MTKLTVLAGPACTRPAQPLPDDCLQHVVGGAGAMSPLQLDALLRAGTVPDPAAIRARSVTP